MDAVASSSWQVARWVKAAYRKDLPFPKPCFIEAVQTSRFRALSEYLFLR
jgi:hypothetical protein